jgi:hypothetical protein
VKSRSESTPMLSSRHFLREPSSNLFAFIRLSFSVPTAI